MGRLVAGVSVALWNNTKACGRKYRVRCIGGAITHPCHNGQSVVVTIVDFCQPPCDGILNLSEDAFDVIADRDAGKVRVEYNHLMWLGRLQELQVTRVGLMLGMFSLYVGNGDSRKAEMLAILKAISLCAHSAALIGKEIDIVSNSAEAVSWVNAAGVGNLAFMNIIQEIQQFLFILGNTRVIFNFRSSNSLADSLARNGSGKGADLLFGSCRSFC
ncbi:hypothetical protein Ddye_014591 [Dipteronia dyeriana]|uniref:Expansin-like EG45 domain-containing protein n=1 Tax=Dipteronia dyeriana TaxID=168575 RepID=A0AAD9X898_9ROSI|nr:hypothetical protein Ddye_014591 [Dipteronia dyeriana]